MEFLDISSLGTAYRYATKIEQKFKQKKPLDLRIKSKGKVSPNRRKMTKPRHGGPIKPTKSTSK